MLYRSMPIVGSNLLLLNPFLKECNCKVEISKSKHVSGKPEVTSKVGVNEKRENKMKGRKNESIFALEIHSVDSPKWF